jgi:hypothetical protein
MSEEPKAENSPKGPCESLAKATDDIRPTLAQPPKTPNETPIDSPQSAGNPQQPGWDRKIHSL